MAETSMAARDSDEDRLSSLPDVLLHAIMSFVPARQAVQTCVLSRRWVDLWCSVPCLEIDRWEFKAARWDWDGCESNENISHLRERDANRRFVNFVDSLLMFFRAPSLDTFRLCVTNDHDNIVDCLRLDRWIRRGIKCCPEVLEICHIAYEPSYELPHLGSGSCRLKRMHLAGLYLHKNFTLQLHSGCPVLEYLVFEKCLVAYPEIMSRTLKNLVIIDGCTTHWGNALNVKAPSLVSWICPSAIHSMRR